MPKQSFIGQWVGKLQHALSAPKNGQTEIKADPKRVGYRLKYQRQTKANMAMDAWKSAQEAAENPPKYDRRQLYAMYRECLKDLELLSQLNTAKFKITSEAFAIVDRVTGEIDEDKSRLLKRKWFDNFVKHAIDADFWGHSLLEFGQLLPRVDSTIANEFHEINLIPREHVKPELGIVVIQPQDQEGIPYREKPLDEFLIEIGDPKSLGLFLPIVREVIWKNYSRTDWSTRGELYGQPTIVIKTSTTDEAEIAKKEQMAANVGTNKYVILDDQDEFELSESNQAFTWQLFKELIAYCDEQMSKGVNGQVATASENAFVGSSEVQERILNTYTKARLRALAYDVNDKLIPLLMRHGYPFDPKNDEFVYLGLMESDDEDGGDNINTDQEDPQDDPQDRQPKGKKKLAHRGGGMGKRYF